MTDEPYRGGRALFNADAHAKWPDWAPREDWVILDARTIECVKPVGER